MGILLIFVVLCAVLVITMPLQKKSVLKWQENHSSAAGDIFDSVWRPSVAEAKMLYEMEKQIPAPTESPDLVDFDKGKKIIITMK